MKKKFYIFSFTVLGVLLQLIIHGLLEQWYIGLLLADFNKYGLGFSWAQWFFIHHVLTAVFLAAGILFGFWQGRVWWEIIYEKKKI